VCVFVFVCIYRERGVSRMTEDWQNEMQNCESYINHTPSINVSLCAYMIEKNKNKKEPFP
jgi:hypothetical protein